MTDRTCGGADGTKACAWWDCHNRPNAIGTCRYNAPTLVPDDDNGPLYGWPKTFETHWCRHHATTRGWGEERRADIAAADEALLDVQHEQDRLKARCQEARNAITCLLESYNPEASENFVAQAQSIGQRWLEGSDDES